MRQGIAAVLLLAVAGCSAALPNSSPAPTHSPRDLERGPIRWQDDFDGPTLDPNTWMTLRGRGKGFNAPFNAEIDDSGFAADQAEVRDGELHLKWTRRPTAVGNTTYPYAAGIATTAPGVAFTYGVIEARVWVPDTGGILPALWLLPAAVPDQWPPEIDIAEWVDEDGNGRLNALFNIHWKGGDGRPAKLAEQPRYATDVGGQWHTYRLHWRPDRLTLFFDDAQVYDHRGPGVPQEPMYLILSAGVAKGARPAEGSVRVDHVRVWE